MGQEAEAMPLGIEQNNHLLNLTLDVWQDQIFFDDSVLEDGKVECPNCGATLEFDPADLVEDEEEKDD